MKEIYKKALVNVLFTVFVAALLIVLIPKIWIYFLPFLIAWLIAACKLGSTLPAILIASSNSVVFAILPPPHC